MSGSKAMQRVEWNGIFPVDRGNSLAPALAELRQGGRLFCRGAAALLREAAGALGGAVLSAHSLTLWTPEAEGRQRP